MSALETIDAFDARLARGIGGALRAFNDAGILSTSDIHVALRLARLSGADDEIVSLGAAFAARAPRLGNVCVDLATIHTTADADTDTPTDIGALPWPAPPAWIRQMAASGIVGDGRPLHLEGTTLYLDRLWVDESLVATELRERSEGAAPGVDMDLLRSGLDELFDDPDQRIAGATAVLRRLSVIAGGPGTGKTTTVARVLALLDAQATAAGQRPPLVALAAPTGKAAARLEDAVRQGADAIAIDQERRERLQALSGKTVHRLLGFNPGNRTRFRHYRLNRLPHDVVVVDETSMVSLSLMARLLEAVRSDARLLLVGDPEQLASVEAGAVLGDIVGPAALGPAMPPAARQELADITGLPVSLAEGAKVAPFGAGVAVLRTMHRFGQAIGALAQAIREDNPDEAMDILRAGDAHVQWITTDAAEAVPSADALADVRRLAVDTGRAVIGSARAGDARAAIDALGSFRFLCGHRRGPEGVATWMDTIENWLRSDVEGFTTGATWYVGRPLIVTQNDYALDLYNGDTGVVIESHEGRLVAAFERRGTIAEVSPTRLAAVDTVYAMTVHKSQGSQYEAVAFLVPGPDSRVLTRELLYTAVTRARERLIVVGPELSIRAAIERPITRASGLRQALWGEAG